ncbi:MAG: hypothetical protein ACOCP8_01895 [archaeon]
MANKSMTIEHCYYGYYLMFIESSGDRVFEDKKITKLLNIKYNKYKEIANQYNAYLAVNIDNQLYFTKRKHIENFIKNDLAPYLILLKLQGWEIDGF